MNLHSHIDAPRSGDFSETVPVFWVFKDCDSAWRVRREGEFHDIACPSRRQAILTASASGAAEGSYWLYLQLADGRFALELLNTAGYRANEAKKGVAACFVRRR